MGKPIASYSNLILSDLNLFVSNRSADHARRLVIRECVVSIAWEINETRLGFNDPLLCSCYLGSVRGVGAGGIVSSAVSFNPSLPMSRLLRLRSN